MMTEQFLDTVKRCYKDLYWCWKNTGLSGSLSLELANTWADSTGPLQAHFEESLNAWNATLTDLKSEFGYLCIFSKWVQLPLMVAYMGPCLNLYARNMFW